MRRKAVQNLDQPLALFEVKRLTYKFQALTPKRNEEARALEIMRVIEQYARDYRHDVKELCIQFVYETADWLSLGIGSGDFVFQQTSILMECIPIGFGGLVAPSRKPLSKHGRDLLNHAIDIAGEIAYDICKYVRVKAAAEKAIIMLYTILRFTDLNNLAKSKEKMLHEFNECERICKQPGPQGHPFDDGLQLLKLWKEEALSHVEVKKRP
ncbi:MAG: hypothetical protein ACRD4V_04840 [Candidatus Acidiferrales bacterium]